MNLLILLIMECLKGGFNSVLNKIKIQNEETYGIDFVVP